MGLTQAVASALGSRNSSDPDRFAQEHELLTSDGTANDFFGFSVALSNDGHTALVGPWFKNDEQGAAYIFTEHDQTWTEQQKLAASDGAIGDEFGYSVALSGTPR
jgi:hypothetical protein